jgi:hypothetical protein
MSKSIGLPDELADAIRREPFVPFPDRNEQEKGIGDQPCL